MITPRVHNKFSRVFLRHAPHVEWDFCFFLVRAKLYALEDYLTCYHDDNRKQIQHNQSLTSRHDISGQQDLQDQ